MAYFGPSRSSLAVLAACLWLPSLPLAAQSFAQGNPGVDRYLQLDDGLYELNADGTYHKVNSSSARPPQASSSESRPATSSSSGRYTGQERFMRFDDGLYERMADGTYMKVDERRQMQQQSQSGRYGSSSTSMDPRWQQQYGRQEYWEDHPQQWNNNRPQWSNNIRPQQWPTNNRPQPGPVAVDPMLMGNTGQDRTPRSPAPGRRPPAVDSMLNDGTGQGVGEKAEVDPWYEMGRSIRRLIDAEAQRGRRGR